MSRLLMGFLALLLWSAPLPAQNVAPESFVLDNGMEFLLLPRKEEPNVVAVGWVARVGSVNERPGITGISHFFEHMMFKGTTTIGTRSSEEDLEFARRQHEVRSKLRNLHLTVQYQRWKSGEIDDPWAPANDSEEMVALRVELKSLMDEHRAVIVKDEFDQIYTKAGSQRMNAFTSHDLTFYINQIPSNKFELWSWMESDRLSDSVFREFYSERDVVHEERRLRTESTPTGIFQEQFEALFWQSSPYSWPVIGWSTDLNSYTFDQARAYYDIYYRPNNLVGVVVGDFESEPTKQMIARYFGRLEAGEAPPPVVTLESQQIAEKRMYAECDCQPQIEVRYHSVPFDHRHEYALEVMAEILNGRTGRLYRSLVEDQGIASSASVRQDSRKYGGAFSFFAECKGDASPEQLEEAWYAELKLLMNEPVSELELQKIKNQVLADSYRRLQSNFFLMIQLGYAEALGGWEYINTSPKNLQKVTADDILEVANTYFEPKNRAVAIYRRKAGLAAPTLDPALAALSPEVRGMVEQQLKQLMAIQDLEQLVSIRMELEGQAGQVPADFKGAFDYLLEKLTKRIDDLQTAEKSTGETASEAASGEAGEGEDR